MGGCFFSTRKGCEQRAVAVPCRRVGSRLVKDIHRLTRLRDPEDQERCIGARLDSAVPVIDVDSRFAESRRRARQLPWTMAAFHLRALTLGLSRSFAFYDPF